MLIYGLARLAVLFSQPHPCLMPPFANLLKCLSLFLFHTNNFGKQHVPVTVSPILAFDIRYSNINAFQNNQNIIDLFQETSVTERSFSLHPQPKHDRLF